MGNSMQKEMNEQSMEDFTCEICYEPQEAIKRFRIPQRQHREGNHPFCTNCIAKFIEVQVEDGAARVSCPGLNCDDHLDPLLCRSIVAPKVFDKWSDNLCDAYLLGVDRCYCPDAGCRELVCNECGGNVRKTKCPRCKKLFCFKCKIPWHAGFRCDESEQRRDQSDVALGKLVEKRVFSRCPACGHGVQLTKGCTRIRCRCQTTFCFQCGEKRCRCKGTRACICCCSCFCLMLVILVVLVCFSPLVVVH